MYNFLGTRIKVGEELFRKIDKDCVVDSCKLAKQLNAGHFLNVNAKGANANSMFLYMRVKGEAIEELKKVGANKVSVLLPGLIKNRGNDYRFGEKFASWIPFIDKISSTDLAKFSLLYTEEILEKQRSSQN